MLQKENFVEEEARQVLDKIDFSTPNIFDIIWGTVMYENPIKNCKAILKIFKQQMNYLLVERALFIKPIFCTHCFFEQIIRFY